MVTPRIGREAVKRMISEGKNLTEIAHALGYKHNKSARDYMRRNGIAYTEGKKYTPRSAPPNNPKLYKEGTKIRKIREEPYHSEVLSMFDNGIEPQDIADHFGKHFTRIYQILRYYRGPDWRNWKTQILTAIAQTPAAPYQVIANRLQMEPKIVADFMRQQMRDDTQQLAEKEMKERQFHISRGLTNPDTGMISTAMSIFCGTCENKMHYYTKQFNNHQAAKKFRDAGWAVGGAARADRCPSCLANLESGKTNGATKVEVDKKVVDVALVSHKSRQDPPPVQERREITRTDRRIIIAKLNDVYGENSYMEDWSDEKVSQDLGVPKDWVSEVRDDNFGPDISEAGAAMRMEQIEKLAATIKDEQKRIMSRYDDFRKGLDILHDAADVLEHSIKANENRYAEFEKLYEAFQH